MRRIVGLSAFHADASAAAVADGRFVAGVEEERFRRIKHWAGFPEQALRFLTGAQRRVVVEGTPQLGEEGVVVHVTSRQLAVGRRGGRSELDIGVGLAFGLGLGAGVDRLPLRRDGHSGGVLLVSLGLGLL